MAEWIQVAIAVACAAGAVATTYAALIVRNLQTGMRAMRELLEVQLSTLREEVSALRKWRHDFGPKEMVYDDFGHRIQSLEGRMLVAERDIAVHVAKGER